MWGLGSQVLGLGFEVLGRPGSERLGFEVLELGFEDWGLVPEVWGLGSKALGFEVLGVLGWSYGQCRVAPEGVVAKRPTSMASTSLQSLDKAFLNSLPDAPPRADGAKRRP